MKGPWRKGSGENRLVDDTGCVAKGKGTSLDLLYGLSGGGGCGLHHA